ncbi:MAG: Mut7-C RNAse domain-containing protein, partial [Deltaproteobacteria bacterium]|nr:Mut7-C RNAse domain-containing protein [Deltaproteobacteria bacterium]
ICSISTPFDITRKTRLRPHPFDTIRFVADVNVGKLAKLLLTLGFDTEYSNGFSDDTVAEIAFRNKRVVLTRDTSLLKRKKVIFAKRIRQERPKSQLKEVLEYFGLDKGPFEFLSRCTTCNRKLQPIQKQTIVHRLEPKTRKYYDTFKICPGCCRIFWQGSHYEDMKNRFANDFLRIK